MIKPCIGLLAFGSLVSAAPLPIAIGTNTGGSGKSEGIYLSTFDPESGTIGEVKLGAKYGNPGFLALHPTQALLYSVGRSPHHPKGTVAAFRLGETLSFLGDAPVAGDNPCHLAVDPTGKAIAVANYGDGTTAILGIDAQGAPVAPAAPVMKGEGTGPNPARQEGPHAHGVYFQEGLLFVPDLGLDKVLTFKPDMKLPSLSAHTPPHWSGAPGAGPRHMAFSPDGKHAYVVNELGNTVTACRFDKQRGALETIHSVATLSEGEAVQSTTAEIAVHPNGKFVYASNRGHDSIAVFARDAGSGKLSRIQIAPCGGKIPRHFTIAPGGEWLLCAHQESNTLAALPLDPATGKLGAPGTAAACPNPICIIFLPTKG
ncbi:lactonase family protein [Luteolibacter marinus]|uniref:lactonase family protein n=1 Tax=Luteolibacter marinus TaxID=2776705 RepID=UPI001868FF9D|nr:lactonase family protein [Luteolibacter marinus]